MQNWHNKDLITETEINSQLKQDSKLAIEEPICI